jgi:hypothetical protein
MTTLITVLPVGWVGEWHENPKPQWIVPLSGRWFVESMDGQRVEMGPGEISFGADQGTREHDGRKGHLSGTVGDREAVLWLVQLDETPATIRAAAAGQARTGSNQSAPARAAPRASCPFT